MENPNTNDLREARYTSVMNPFAEYLPYIWPSNSDAYFTLLASKMRAAGMAEESEFFNFLY